MEDVKAKLEELRKMTEGTEDQKTLAVLSLMWIVERRKEELWEEPGSAQEERDGRSRTWTGRLRED